MTDKKVLSLITKEQTQQEDYKKDLLEIIDNFRQMIVDDEILEFAISSFHPYCLMLFSIFLLHFLEPNVQECFI